MNIKNIYLVKRNFFIPKGIEYTIKNNGSRERYDNQKANFDKIK